MSMLKCAHCGFEAADELWVSGEPCPRGHKPKPKTCGKQATGPAEMGADPDSERVASAVSASGTAVVGGRSSTSSESSGSEE
jgi:hypothetical protein